MFPRSFIIISFSLLLDGLGLLGPSWHDFCSSWTSHSRHGSVDKADVAMMVSLHIHFWNMFLSKAPVEAGLKITFPIFIKTTPTWLRESEKSSSSFCSSIDWLAANANTIPQYSSITSHDSSLGLSAGPEILLLGGFVAMTQRGERDFAVAVAKSWNILCKYPGIRNTPLGSATELSFLRK